MERSRERGMGQTASRSPPRCAKCRKPSALCPLRSTHTLRAIQKPAFERGIRTLVDDGIARALSGMSTIEEVSRVVNN